MHAMRAMAGSRRSEEALLPKDPAPGVCVCIKVCAYMYKCPSPPTRTHTRTPTHLFSIHTSTRAAPKKEAPKLQGQWANKVNLLKAAQVRVSVCVCVCVCVCVRVNVCVSEYQVCVYDKVCVEK
jgi:hypothetical protein